MLKAVWQMIVEYLLHRLENLRSRTALQASRRAKGLTCEARRQAREWRRGRWFWKPALLVFLLAFSHSSLASAQAVPAWVGEFKTVASQLGSSRLPEVVQRFETLWKNHPQEPALANAIGGALDSAGYHQAATEWYQRALKLDPTFAPAWNNLGLNYASLKLYRRAVEPLKKAAELDPQNERPFYNLGLVQLQLRDFEKAAASFRRAHVLKPLGQDPLTRLAYANFRARRNEQGLRALNAFLGLPGDRQESLLTAVRLLNEVGLHPEALALLREDGTVNQRSVSLQFEECRTIFFLGRYEEAVKCLQGREAGLGPDVRYRLLLGSAQALAGDLPASVQSLQTAVRLAPREPEAYYRLSMVFMAGFRDREAEDTLKAGLAEVPHSSLLWNGLATLYEIVGRHSLAIDCLQRSLNIQPSQADTWGKLGELYTQSGEFDKAQQAFQKAIQQGAAAQTQALYADLLIRLRRLQEAQQVLARAKPKLEVPELNISLGKLHLANQNFAEAEKAFRRVLELAPQEGAVHYLLARTLKHQGKDGEARQEFDQAARLKDHERQRKIWRKMLMPVDPSSAIE